MVGMPWKRPRDGLPAPEMPAFPGYRGTDLSFCPGTSARMTPGRPRDVFRADFWEGDATKHFSVKKGLFSEKGGRQFSE